MVIFIAALLFGIWMLLSGKEANKRKRRYEFLVEKISEEKAKKEEEENRQKQEEEYQKRIAL